MMQFLTGKQDKSQKKTQSELIDTVKNQLKKQFCQICKLNQSSKVAFGKQFKPVFTCSSCQMKAVGGIPQRLGHKTLINIDKFTQTLAKQIINYQNCIKNPPAEYKTSAQSCKAMKQKSLDMTTKITQQYKKMKKIVKDKQDSLIQQALKINSITVFDEVIKMIKDKKTSQIDNGYLLLKKIFCNNKGIHFTDHQSIQNQNNIINQKISSVKKQSKIKIKPLDDLIEEINKIQLQ